MNKIKKENPIGYLWLKNYLENKDIKVYPYFRETYVIDKGINKIVEKPNVQEYYVKQKNIDNNIWWHIEFALKHEGLNLAIFEYLFDVIDKIDLHQYVATKPNGKYNRIVWFLYEWLTENKLDLPDVDTRIYVELLDSKDYYTGNPINYKRYAIKENLLGNKKFCPFIRKTDILYHYENLNLKDKVKNTIDKYDQNIIKRASSYLYYKETKSSNEIEREKPSQAKLAKFINILENIESLDDLSKMLLIEIQNTIVETRFTLKDYRTWQNYVGEAISFDYQKIHYVSPKGDDVESLMQGLLDCSNRMQNSNLPSILIAAVVSFGFVFIHPFEDGNGRIHRFLIHYILSKTNFAPKNIIFPVSSTMLNNIEKYDECLESFSKPLISLIDYELDDDARMTVLGETKNYYKFIDMTKIAEYLYTCIIDTIEISFVEELEFIIKFDKSKKEIVEIVEMPDKDITLFIRLCKQNNGRLAKNKRKTLFHLLTDDEVVKLETVFNNNFG